MRAYRAYRLDEAGLVMRAKVIEARTDDEALRLATAWAAGDRLELWTGSRVVAAPDRKSGP
jgi:hypothetical protein